METGEPEVSRGSHPFSQIMGSLTIGRLRVPVYPIFLPSILLTDLSPITLVIVSYHETE